MLAEGGVFTDDIVAEEGTHPITSPEDWWAVVLGSGYRGTFEQLSPEHRQYVREQSISYIDRNGIREIETNVVYAVADKT
jgi:hypothetical protein